MKYSDLKLADVLVAKTHSPVKLRSHAHIWQFRIVVVVFRVPLDVCLLQHDASIICLLGNDGREELRQQPEEIAVELPERLEHIWSVGRKDGIVVFAIDGKGNDSGKEIPKPIVHTVGLEDVTPAVQSFSYFGQRGNVELREVWAR